MKHIILFILCACSLSASAQSRQLLLCAHSLSASEQTLQLQFMSYNVKHCCGNDNVVDEKRVADVINQFTPDIVAVQELDSMNNRTMSYQIKNLGTYTKMNYTYAASIAYKGGAYGIGMLSKEKPLSVKRIPLPGDEPRMLLVCEFKDYVFACTHLALEVANRLTSIQMILEEAQTWDKPFFIAGDFNASPTSGVISQFKKNFTILTNTELPTHPSDNPTTCIDYIAQYNNSANELHTKLISNQVVNEAVASDHCPVLINIQLDKLKEETVNQQKQSAYHSVRK